MTHKPQTEFLLERLGVNPHSAHLLQREHPRVAHSNHPPTLHLRDRPGQPILSQARGGGLQATKWAGNSWTGSRSKMTIKENSDISKVMTLYY